MRSDVRLKTALVTGGSGFLGSHICDRLIAEGMRVLCLDNFLTGRVSNLQHLMDNADFRFFESNVTDHISIGEEIDYILHFASPASPRDYALNPIHTLKVGAIGTLNALGLARSKKARFLLASTSEVYGDPLESPQQEKYWGNVNPVGPRSVYDEAKRFAEAITMAYYREHAVDARIVRIFNTYGPRMRPHDGRALPNFITQALKNDDMTVYGNGSQTRSFCYVDDLVEGIFRLLQVPAVELGDVDSRLVNLGNPDEITILDMANMVREMIQSASDIIFTDLPTDDPRVRRPDITRANQLLDWAPSVTFPDGLSRTVEHFKSDLSLAP